MKIEHDAALVMDCSTFKRKHDAFVDDTLAGVEMEAMRAHVRSCARCARLNQDVQRALFVARNLPRMRVSEDFEARLRARLATERPGMRPPPSWSMRGLPSPWILVGMSAVAVVALSGRTAMGRGDGPARLPAVVASSPFSAPFESDDPAPAFVASMSTGLPMWPALMLAEEGPLLFAADMSAAVNDERER